MKLITYSDLHLEFGKSFQIPPNAHGDVLVMAGDIISFNQVPVLADILQC